MEKQGTSKLCKKCASKQARLSEAKRKMEKALYYVCTRCSFLYTFDMDYFDELRTKDKDEVVKQHTTCPCGYPMVSISKSKYQYLKRKGVKHDSK